MRYLICCIILVLLYSACSTSESVTETDQEKAEATRPLIPDWYSKGVHSSTDSLSFHGYSLTSASDSSSSVQLATENSLKYLRFEIDRTVEEIREDLARSQHNSYYNSSTFIIELRNAVAKAPLTNASFSRMHRVSDNGIHFSYTRASLPKSALYGLFVNQIDDHRFLQSLQNFPI